MELLVYKASAGSGKTFTLAVEYIKHLVLNPKAYQQILAVTFTNKATAEMKERILQQLQGIWQKAPSSEAYLNSIREGLKEKGTTLTDDEIRRRCGTALLNMLHDYSRFRVETIDSFFQSVMRNLARELELAPNLNIELDQAKVLSDAVDGMMEKLLPNSPALAWLLSYINERIADDKRWNVSDELKAFGRYLFDENYMERGELLREKMRNPDAVRLYREVLRELETKALERMKAYADRFESELTKCSLVPDDLKGGSRGIGSYFRKLREGKLTDKDVLNVTLQNCLDDAQNWAKNGANRNTVVNLAASVLMPLLREAENERARQCRTLNSCRLSLQHLYKLQLLNQIGEEVRIQNHEHNRFLLPDTNDLLHRLVGRGDSSFVFEKLGANIRSVMIDEFQDTSRMQWDNFRLLLLEGLSQGADSLIVGDVKQSIYRWRNGDWRILNNLGKTLLDQRFPVNVKTLKVNRRSQTNIIRFNNLFFNSAVRYLNQKHIDELGEECLPLKGAYADVAQKSPKTEAQGYVQVAFVEPDEEHTYTEAMLVSLGEETQRLLDMGVKPSDMAILVRKNKNIVPIADYFEQVLGLPVVSDEAFRLDASEVLCMLVDALRCLANPDEGIARASLVMNHRHNLMPDETWDEILDAGLPDAYLPAGFVERADELRLMPLYELLEELYRLFEMQRVEGQDAYVLSFFDSAAEYLQDHPADLNDFIRYWDETLCGKTIPGGEVEGIRIFSIHKSKGLEFHTVLIPFCDWKMENERNNQLVWCIPTEPPFDNLDLVPVNYSAGMAESIYRDAYLQERMQLWVDNLNLLYVAFTRAGSNLVLWTRKNQNGTMSELLAQALPTLAEQGEGSWDDEATIYESGTPLPSLEAVHPAGHQERQATQVHMCSMTHPVEFRQSNRSSDFMATADEAAAEQQRFIDRGRMLHTLFSDIETEADIEPAIRRLVSEGIIAHPETEADIRAVTHKAFVHPQVKDWYSGQWQLYNECDIIWLEDGKLCKRRPDRVMVKEGEWVVVDFKFGKPRKEYQQQVREYMQLLRRMGHAEDSVSGYLWYVDRGMIEKIV